MKQAQRFSILAAGALLVSVMIVTLASPRAQALEEGCRLHPSQINQTATRIIQTHVRQGRAVPDALPIRLSASGTINGAGLGFGVPGSMEATLEGFFRPVEDSFYSLIPIPLFGVELSRARHLLYICAHVDTDVLSRHITIYLMRGNQMQRTDIGTIISDSANGPGARVAPMSIIPIGTAPVNNLFNSIFGGIPLLGDLARLPWEAFQGAQRLVGRVLTDFSGLGVERIVVTEDYIEFSAGVDLSNPSRARLIKRLDWAEIEALMPPRWK